MAKTVFCNAPCIINTASGHHLVFCDQDPGHQDDHTYEMRDLLGERSYTVSWNYTGFNSTAYNHVPPLDQRCGRWISVDCIPGVAADPQEGPPHRHYLLKFIEPKADERFSLCCEKPPGHGIQHVRSGVFSPLGMTWRVSWFD